MLQLSANNVKIVGMAYNYRKITVIANEPASKFLFGFVSLKITVIC